MEPTPQTHAVNGSTDTTTSAPDSQALSYKAILIYTVIALVLAIVVRFFVAAPYIVSGASMSPTFETWHYLIIDRLSYATGAPERGDVVVFRFPHDPSRSFIKRIIGLPGETVVLENTRVTIVNDEHPEGLTLDEPYIDSENVWPADTRTTLKDNEYFVMGDNRRASADSRIWGPLPEEYIVGRAFLRLLPIHEFDVLPGEIRYSANELAA